MKPLRSFIFTSIAAMLFFPINLFALHLLLRGHDAPGGGFIAGAGTALSLILLALAYGAEGMQRIVRVDPMRIAAAGVALAFATAALPLLSGRPMLDQQHFELRGVPLFGDVAFSTTLAFDVGVYLLVLGGLTKMFLVLVRSIEGIGAFLPGGERPYAAIAEEPIEESDRRRRREEDRC